MDQQVQAMVPVSWLQIRSLNASQREGFEELCCQLAHAELIPNALQFVRKGKPDAGLECYWALTNGDEWGWQAKFVPGLGKTQWGECDRSVKTALEKHPKLTRFYLCVPCEFADGRQEDQVSAMDQWDLHVKKWSDWSAVRGMKVDFFRWDSHELLFRLSKPEHRGRLWFWFSAPSFDHAWFVQRTKESVKQAEERYTPEIHFELDVAARFEALARDKNFQAKLNKAAAELGVLPGRCNALEGIEVIAEAVLRLKAKLNAISNAAKALPTDIQAKLDFRKIQETIAEAQVEIHNVLDQVRTWRRAESHDTVPNHVTHSGPSENTEYSVREIESALRIGAKIYHSDDARLATLPVMLLSGDAGFGKTHLLCSIAERRTAAGFPTVLLLGERFDGSEPWTNTLQLLGLPCAREEFLGALDAAGEASGSRALILIDAINEGVGVEFWKKHIAAMVTAISEFPHLGLAISIRSAYEPQLGKLIAKDSVRILHNGFYGHVAAASRHFFQRYGLAEPNVPVLNPEFENPLFLKLVCVAVKESGRPEVPSFLRSVTTVFSFILSSVNRRLAVLLDYDENEDRVSKAVQRLAQLMAERGSEFLPIELVKQELGQIHSNDPFSRSLFRHLTTEHILVRLPTVGGSVGEERVRFTYQRLSDHLVARSLLSGITRDEAAQLFKSGGALARYAKSNYGLYSIAGWIEALAIQLPETHGLEIDQVLDFGVEDDLVRRAFIASIIWRKPTAFTPETARRVEKILSDPLSEEAFELLDGLISVSAVADHPYNGRWLDGWLRPHTMAERDAFWSIYLFGKIREETSILRLIEWSWAERAENIFPQTVVQPAALALAWCLTTSDRFVRDRATKALVALLDSNLELVRWLLRHFNGVEEPYVQERLYAVAAGCALRNPRSTGIQELAQYVYDSIFSQGSPPASVLLRDHARGVVESAIRHGATVIHHPKLLIPPYSSSWPKAPPSLKQLNKLYGGHNINTQDAGMSLIIDSITADDFKHYVINDVHSWHKRPIKRRPLSPREEYTRLVESLSPENARILENYAVAVETLNRKSRGGSMSDDLDEERMRFVESVDHMLPSILGPRRAKLFFTRIVPFLKDTWNDKYQQHFPLELFQRLILWRVLQLGWTPERFGVFDKNVPVSGRDARKPERIGKKYQWIAYDEFHARISDNFGMADSSTEVMDSHEWERGTWPAIYRDLDPTLLLRSSPRLNFQKSEINWWVPHAHTDWGTNMAAREWLKRTSDLPPVIGFISARRSDGSRWMLLHNYASWRRNEFDREAWHSENDRYEVHYIIRSYFVRREHLTDTMEWGRKQNWINDLLPSPGHDYRHHLCEHYRSVHYEYPIEDDWVKDSMRGEGLPHPVLPTTADYLAEQSGYDCSVDETISMAMPSRAVAQMADIRISGRCGDFVDSHGRLVAFDPSTREKGHSALAFQESALKEFMDRNGLAVFWTLLGEKNVYSPDSADKWHGRLTMLGIYSWTGGQIDGDYRTELHPGRG